MSVLGVIDVGSNTVRLLVIEGADAKHYRVLHQAQEITRLGQGLSEGKPLLPAAQKRTLAALEKFCQQARNLGVQDLWALGTSAMRRASNAPEFMSLVRQTCNLELETVSGIEEARITLQGLETIIPTNNQQYLLIDIGGGSTEFIMADGRGGIGELCSIELGAVSLTEKFLLNDPPDEHEFKQLIDYLHQQLSPILRKFKPVSRLLGTAGTITTLAAIAQHMTEYDAGKINGFILQQSQVTSMLEDFKSKPLIKRQETPGLEVKRADIILAGTAILLISMKVLKINQIMVSDAGFREGIVVELFNKTKVQ